MILQTATPDQATELSKFYKKFPIHGPIELQVDRGQNFFSSSQIQTEQSLSYTLRSEKNELLGVATFNIFQSQLNEKKVRIAIGRDLRILPQRRAIMGWAQHFLPVMEEIRQVFGVSAFFATLNLHEHEAMNAFIRPQPGKRPIPRYALFRRFHLISLHGKFPWAPKPLNTIKIRRGSAQISSALADFIVRKHQERDLGILLNPQDFFEILDRWPNLKLDDFLVAFDSLDNIVGCCAPWNPGEIEQQIPLKFNMTAHNFRQFLKFGHLFGWTRKLTKPIHRLTTPTSLEFRYLCFLFAENPDIFDTLAWVAYHEARENEFLVYTQMRSDLHLRPHPSWVSGRRDYALYGLIPPDQQIPEVFHPGYRRTAQMEHFFV